MADNNKSGDSTELESLFDSVANAKPVTLPRMPSPLCAPTLPEKKSSILQQLNEGNSGTNDSPDLESLFDSVAAKSTTPVASSFVPKSPEKKTSILQQINEGNSATNDSPDLESLFDSISAEKNSPHQATKKNLAADQEEWNGQEKVFNQVGQMARKLHDALGGLGYDTEKYDKLIEKAVDALPDTNNRLSYIATLTEQAASKVLNATDLANPIQDELESASAQLGAKWDAVYANQVSVEEFKQLADETRLFFRSTLPQQVKTTRAQLLEIMMAQDFQDLTGQVIKKILSLSQEVENQLMGVLVDTMPGAKRTDSVESLLNGPVINAEGRTDVVANQEQVDDLLASLGF